MTDRCPVHGPDRHGSQAAEVLLMADYGCFLWSNSEELWQFRDSELNLDPALLGVSADLIGRMRAWHEEWEEVAYANVGFSSREARRAWERRGWELARALQDELRHIEVHYQYDSRGPLPAAGGERLRRPSVVRLMPDHGGVFLWNMSPERGPSDAYALDPEDLGLSDGLVERLDAWYATWERGWGRMSGHFASSGGAGPAAWRREGHRLAQRLKQELGPAVVVWYFDDEVQP